MAELIRVASVGDIEPLGQLVVEVEGVEVIVFNVDNQTYYAVENTCTHDGGTMDDGELIDTYELECPRHGARFDIRSGEALVMPAFEPVETFPVVIKDNDIYLSVDW